MHSNIQLTKKMFAYCKRNGVEAPRASILTNRWGTGKKTLAWRVSGDIHKKKPTRMKQTALHTMQLDEWFFPATKAEKALAYARKELGVHETPTGSNDGPRVHWYQAATGAFRQPWCASFVTKMLLLAGFRLPMFNKAYVPAWHATAKAGKGNVKQINRIFLQPGDLVTLWNDEHIEMFEKWIVRGVSFKAIGGNTSIAGKNSNGGMVCNTTRYINEISCAIRVS